MLNNNNNIASLDNLFEALYSSKFNNWLIGKVLRPVVEQDKWHIRSSDMNIQLVFNKGITDDLSFIKGRFYIGLIHIASIEEAAAYQYDITDYSYKPNLIGHLDIKPVKEDNETYFQISYLFNFFSEFDLLKYFDRLYEQIEVIREDLRFRLGIDLIDSISMYNQDLNRDKDNFSDDDDIDEDDDDDDDDDSSILSPYDLGGN